MPRPRIDWPPIKAAYEQGAEIRDLAVAHDCYESTIYQRIRREGWVRLKDTAAVEGKRSGVYLDATKIAELLHCNVSFVYHLVRLNVLPKPERQNMWNGLACASSYVAFLSEKLFRVGGRRHAQAWFNSANWESIDWEAYLREQRGTARDIAKFPDVSGVSLENGTLVTSHENDNSDS